MTVPSCECIASRLRKAYSASILGHIGLPVYLTKKAELENQAREAGISWEDVLLEYRVQAQGAV